MADDATSEPGLTNGKEPKIEKNVASPPPLLHPPASLESLSLLDQFKYILHRNPDWKLKEEDEANILGEVITHCEKVDKYEKWGKDIDTEGLQTIGADAGLKSRALPVLSNLTTQLLHIFATYAYNDLVTVVAEPDSEAGKAGGAYLNES